MKKNIAKMAIIILIIAGLVLAGILLTVNPYIKTETAFGSWEDQLLIQFEDGSTESLNIIQTQPFTIFYKDKAVVAIGLVINAKVTATGTKYDGANIRTSGFGYDVSIKTSSTNIVKYNDSISLTNGTIQVPKDTTKNFFQTNLISVGLKMDQHPETYPDGFYKITFTPKGLVEYQGYPGGGTEWKNVTLPPSRYADLTVVRGEITLILGSEIVG